MVKDEDVKTYIDKMYNNDLFKDMEDTKQDKVIFSALELLKDNFREKDISERAVALQVLYMLESDDADFSFLKNQGVTSYNVKGVSISFEDSNSQSSSKFNGSGLIAPAVLDLLNPSGGAKVGRLI